MCDGHRVSSEAASHSCGCSGHRSDAAGRVIDAATELVLPAVPFPSRRVLDVVGEEKLRQVVHRHHQRLAAGPLAAMFPADADVFDALVRKVEDFIVESCGGAAAYSERHGKTCMRTRHFPFSIDESAREVWLQALFAAMVEADFPAEASEEYWNWLEAFSVRMINRRTMRAQPARITLATAQLRFGAS